MILPLVCSSRLRFPGAALLMATALVFAPAAPAQEDAPVEFREADYAAYTTLRLAKAVAGEKLMFAHDKAKQDPINAEFEKACAGLGWTPDRFEAVDGAVSAALSTIADPENASEEVTKTTLATVKAHQKELENYGAVSQRAQQIVRDQAQAERRGTAPTPAQLAGTWIWDLDLTIDDVASGLDGELRKTLRDSMAKTLVAATYTFGPGNRLVAVNQRPGAAAETQEGSYRIDGNKLTIIARMGSRDREDQVDVGMKDGHLRIGMMGVYSVFRRP